MIMLYLQNFSANGGVSSYKEKSKSPKFMARLMEHIPLNKSASSSSVNTHGESVKYRWVNNNLIIVR